MENSIISGAYDLHVHTSPDYLPRKLDDMEMAQRVINCGMKGYAIKSHSGCTTDRAYIVNKQYPQCTAIGTITLNNYHGGLNPLTVDVAARLGAKIVWFPTTDSVSAFEGYTGSKTRKAVYSEVLLDLMERGIKLSPVRIMDGDGEILPAVRDTIDVIRQNNMVLGTGHLSTEEVFAVVREAHRQGVKKIVITHVSSKSPFRACVGRDLRSLDVQRELLEYGVFMEHSGLPALRGWLSVEEIIEQIKLAGTDRSFLSSDLGQADGKYPDEGLLEFCRRFQECGVSERDIRKMIVDVPEALLN